MNWISMGLTVFAISGIVVCCVAFVGAIIGWVGQLSKRAEEADKRAAMARENSGHLSRKVGYLGERLHQVDQGIGRAIHRIIDMHSGEHSLRLAKDPKSYLPEGGQRHGFIAQGMLRALNIIEEETGRYKEEEEGPSQAYLDTLTLRLAKVGKQLDAIKQSQEADRRLRQDMTLLRQEQATFQQCRFVADQHQQPTTPYPTRPPLDSCKVCGTGAYTYRWGQVISTWYSGNNVVTTRGAVEWQKFDPKFDVGWFPVCAHHACVLDKYGTVKRTSLSDGSHAHEHNPRPSGDAHLRGYSCG